MPELKPSDLTVLFDTRERGYHWTFAEHGITNMKESTLQTADYSVKGMDKNLRIERKEFGDFMSCMTTGRDRFEREMERIMAFPKRVVIVEGSYEDIATGNYRTRMTVNSAIGTLADWVQEYETPFMFCGDRERAIHFAFRYMMNAAKDFRESFDSFSPKEVII